MLTNFGPQFGPNSRAVSRSRVKLVPTEFMTSGSWSHFLFNHLGEDSSINPQCPGKNVAQ